jgi:signal peptidase I
MERSAETLGPIGCSLAAEVIRNFGTLRLSVTGGSMAPAVRPGDTIVVQSCGIGEVSIGEIVVFMRDARLVAHRVKACVRHSEELHLVTCGDRLRKADAPVAGSELLGRVSCIERSEVRIFPVTQRSLAQKMFSRVLSYSNRATSFYLRLA